MLKKLLALVRSEAFHDGVIVVAAFMSAARLVNLVNEKMEALGKLQDAIDAHTATVDTTVPFQANGRQVSPNTADGPFNVVEPVKLPSNSGILAHLDGAIPATRIPDPEPDPD